MALRPGRSRAPATPSLPHPSAQWLRRRGRQPARGGRSAAKHTPAGAEHRPSPPAGRGTAPRASPPTPAPPATTAPSPPPPRPPPLAVRAGHRGCRGASSPERCRQSPAAAAHGEEEVAARAAAYSPAAPANVLFFPPWNPFSRKAGFSPRRPPPSTLHNVKELPPSQTRVPAVSLPPRGAGAEESCPTGSAGGERVLAAPCVRREWSCCKMAAGAHAAGSKPDPVPLASERAPSARARAPA